MDEEQHASGVEDASDNEADAEAQQQEGEEEGVPLLHDLEHYIRSRGLGVAPPENERPSADAWMEDELADREKNAGSAHQDAVHRSVFGERDAKKLDEMAERERFLAGLEGRTIVVTSGGNDDKDGRIATREGVPLQPLAAKCDTVYTLVRSRHLFSRQSSAADDKAVAEIDPENEGAKIDDESNLTLDLRQFKSPSVKFFLAAAARDCPTSAIPDDHIVDVCRIAHFLQCPLILDATVAILRDAIDAQNCLSIAHLADSLGVPSLFEASVSHLVGALESMEEHEHWEHFPTALKHRVLTMRNAIQSSILGRGQKTTVFFSSSEEFLAIFSDHIREQKERLSEAKLRQDAIIKERIHRGGRHRDPYGGDVAYAADKIEKQAKRIETLETFYKEQKEIFSGEDKSAPFRLGYT